MDSAQFDGLARSIGAAASRRGMVRGLAAGLLGAAGLGAAFGETDARKCGKQYDGCNKGKDCCHGLICKKLTAPSVDSEFSGTCAYKRGCGKKNDYCKKNKDCCRKFRCQGRRCKRR